MRVEIERPVETIRVRLDVGDKLRLRATDDGTLAIFAEDPTGARVLMVDKLSSADVRQILTDWLLVLSDAERYKEATMDRTIQVLTQGA